MNGEMRPFGMNNKRALRADGFWVLLKDAARLMVGLGNYQRYCEHMGQVHPDAPVMTEPEYFRYCQEARYPGKSGRIHRCPC